jgi:hypothetical protein
MAEAIEPAQDHVKAKDLVRARRQAGLPVPPGAGAGDKSR